MNTTANVKTLNKLRPKPTFTTRKTTHLNPIKRKMPKTAAEEYLPMVLQPPPEAESVQQYAIPLTWSGRVGSSNDSVKEMWQICNKLDEYTKELENIYGKKNEEPSHMERLFFSFVSTCDLAARELDTTINVEHKILQSLYQGYQKEAQLLEQLGEEDIRADIPASHDKVTALTSNLMEILHKLERIKHSFLNLSKKNPPEQPLVSSPMKIETKRGAQIHGPRLEDHSKETERVVRALQELMTDTDIRSKEVLEKIIHDVGQLFDAQAIELQRLDKDQEQTENKYVKVKTSYQGLLQEKRILEVELQKLLAWKAGQTSSPMRTPNLEQSLENDMEPIPSTLMSSVIKHESEKGIIFNGRSEEIEELTKLSKRQDKAKLQKEAVPPVDSPVSTLHKKAKIQKEEGAAFSEISYAHDLDQGDTIEEPSHPNVAEPKDNGGPESKTVSFSLKEVTEENKSKVKRKKQQLKSLKSRGRRPSTVSSKIKLSKEAGKKPSKTTFTSSEKQDDKSLTENKNQQDPNFFSNVSDQRKTVTKLSRTASSSGKGKAKLNEEDAILTTESTVQSHRAKESASGEQRVSPDRPEPSKSVGKQQGRRQSLSSKSRRLSLAKEEKLENDKEIHKDPAGKIQIMKAIAENQQEKQIADQKAQADSFPEPSVVNMEESKDIYTGHSLSKTTGPEQESFSKDFLEHDRKDKSVRSRIEESDVITQDSGVTEVGQVQEHRLPPYHVSKKTSLSTTPAFSKTDPTSTSDRAEKALRTLDNWVMESCEMEHTEEEASPHYEDTVKAFLSSMSESTQADLSGTFDRTCRTRGNMDFPNFKEQSPECKFSSEEDSHRAQMKSPQRSGPFTSAVTSYPSNDPNIQILDPGDIVEACSRFLSSKKKHVIWKDTQQSQEESKNLASKGTQDNGTSKHQEHLEIPDKADKETAQSGNQPAMMGPCEHRGVTETGAGAETFMKTKDAQEQDFTENIHSMEPGHQTIKTEVGFFIHSYENLDMSLIAMNRESDFLSTLLCQLESQSVNHMTLLRTRREWITQTQPSARLNFAADTEKYHLPHLEHDRQQFGEEVTTQIGQSSWKFEVSNLPLLGQSIGPQTDILKFHPHMIPSQRQQVRKVQANEFLSYENDFPEIFGTELYIQGRHISFTRALPTGLSSPTRPKQKAGIRMTSPLQSSIQPFKRLFDTKTQLFSFLPLDEAKNRTQLLYGKRLDRNILTECSILPTLTLKDIARGVICSSIPSGKWNSYLLKDNGPRKYPVRQITARRKEGVYNDKLL